MFIVGEGSIAAKRLVQITYDAMWQGIVKVKPGVRLGDIGHAIQTFAESNGFSVVREFCGHGIGRSFHEEPQVLHYGKPGHARRARARHDVHDRADDQRRPARDPRGLGDDGWTIVTKDRSLSAQWEHTVLVTDTGYEVLTLSAGSPPPPAFVERLQPAPEPRRPSAPRAARPRARQPRAPRDAAARCARASATARPR